MTDVLVDLGRSHVRVSAGGDERRRAGGAGLADPAGPAGAAAVITAAVGPLIPRGDWRLAVAAPGVATDPELGSSFAALLLASFAPRGPREITVASDSAAWQVGAFRGADGAAVALGTGAVVVARRGEQVLRLDGLGLLLGDVGGGAWIGLAALRRAARSDGGLRRRAVDRFGPRPSWPGLSGSADLPARLAGFAPDVVALADSGDPDARAVLDAAVAGLAQTLAPLPPDLPTVVVGGLADSLGPRLRARLDRSWTTPSGDVLTGLALLLDSPGPFRSELVRRKAAAAVAAHETDLLPTEAVAPGTEDLDCWPTERLVARLAAGHEPAVRAVTAAVPALARAADRVAAAFSAGGRLVYAGAGTPGRLALQDAAELTPTFRLDPGRAVVLLAGGPDAGGRAVEDAEDDREAGAGAVDAAGLGERDVLVGVSASGRTPYVLGALERARDRGAAVVGVSGVPDSPVSRAAQIAVDLPTGAEVIAGSTRLAAGTAQKIALNVLSTAALVRSGATYGPWMVDVSASNAKLRRRCLRIVRDAGKVDEDAAAAALAAADGSVRVALVMVLAGVDAAGARAALAGTGSLRAAVVRAGAAGVVRPCG